MRTLAQNARLSTDSLTRCAGICVIGEFNGVFVTDGEMLRRESRDNTPSDGQGSGEAGVELNNLTNPADDGAVESLPAEEESALDQLDEIDPIASPSEAPSSAPMEKTSSTPMPEATRVDAPWIAQASEPAEEFSLSESVESSVAPSSSSFVADHEVNPAFSDLQVESSDEGQVATETTMTQTTHSGAPAALVAFLTISSLLIASVAGLYAYRLWKSAEMRRRRGWRPYDFELTQF